MITVSISEIPGCMDDALGRNPDLAGNCRDNARYEFYKCYN